MIVTAKLTCSGCGHSGSAEWKAYRPKLIRELKAVRVRFIASASAYGSRGSFLCEGCRCEAETSEEVFLREVTVPIGAMPAARPGLSPSV